MPAWFLDSSALVKAYRHETGTPHVQAMVSGPDPLIAAQLSHLEVSAAIARRAQQTGTSDQQIRAALDELYREVAHSFEMVRADDAIMSDALRLTRVHRLRAADAVQLASALQARARWPELVFVSSDLELNSAAATEGFTIIDPTTQP